MPDDKTRVLAIDDDGQTLEILQRALSSQGYVVVTADSGESGIALYAEKRFDLVLLDIRMPGMDGFEVLSRITECDEEATVIIMTGYGSIDSVVQAMKGGATDYLGKPLDLNHLEIVLQKALKGRRQNEELSLLKKQLIDQGSFEGLVGVSPPMQRVYETPCAS